MQKQNGKSSSSYRAIKYTSGGSPKESDERVSVEEPLEIRIRSRTEDEKPVSVIMRTPTDDMYLAIGFLYTEGIIKDRSQILSINNVAEDGTALGNVIAIEVPDDVLTQDSARSRNFIVNASCGICGKSHINDIFVKTGRLIKSSRQIDSDEILKFPETMRKMQKIFVETGGIHAAGLFRTNGDVILVAEDIGRHNAVDKVVGYMVLNDLTFSEDLVLQVSGRAGFEILQKAAMAGIPFVCSVSAPSSLAIDTAESMNVTLICFVRDGRFNIYAHPERVKM